ncbi:MAG: glycosyltransferase [Chitinophagaceae bacterium]|nr:MAG: glycosyltransferase [Chitinophagaceae bacterium]
MKVVFCAYDGKNIMNGINAWLLRLLPFLSSKGIDATVLFITWADEMECSAIPLLRQLGVQCKVIPKPYYSEKIVKWILEFVNEKQPDIFVANHMPQALFASRFIKEAGIPTVGVLHNDDAEYEALIHQYVATQPEQFLTAVVPVSATLEKKVEKVCHTIVQRIPCGAPVPLDSTTYQSPGKFRIVYIGRIVKEQKNIDRVTETFCKMALSMPQVEAIIYGSGPDEEIVQNILHHYRHPANVLFQGSLPAKQIQANLLKSHVFVLMSSHEGIPVALMEAMGCGVVPICEEIESGIPELIINDETGFLVKNAEDLMKKISYLQQHPKEWNRLSINAKAKVKGGFSSDVSNQKWYALLTGLSGKHVKKPITIPRRFILPPLQPSLAGHDIREPKGMKKFRGDLRRVYKTILHRIR